MPLAPYAPPVSALLTFGDCREIDREHPDWVDYPQQFGLSDADIPDLIRLAIDPEVSQMDSDSAEVWGPVHAWRALGQLRAEAAIAPLITLFDQEDDWLWSDMPKVFSLIGAAAIDPLRQHLYDESQEAESRTVAADCLAQIGKDHPDLKEACAQAIVHQLEQFETTPEHLNGMLVNNVLDLKLVEATPLLERVLTSDRVDLFMTGTWAAAQVELGLKQKEDFSKKELQAPMPVALKQIVQTMKAAEKYTRKPTGFGDAAIAPAKKGKKKKKKG